MRALILSTILS